MPVSLTVLILAAMFIAGGVYMMLERTLSRIIMGFVLLSNGVNLLFLVAIGAPGKPPFESTAAVDDMSDPLPMAMVLTAIVISLALTGFGMALSYRAWQLFGHDEVPDDVEDRRIAHRSRRLSKKKRYDRVAQVGAEADDELGYEDLDEDEEISDDLNSDEDVELDPTEREPDAEAGTGTGSSADMTEERSAQ